MKEFLIGLPIMLAVIALLAFIVYLIDTFPAPALILVLGSLTLWIFGASAKGFGNVALEAWEEHKRKKS